MYKVVKFIFRVVLISPLIALPICFALANSWGLNDGPNGGGAGIVLWFYFLFLWGCLVVPLCLLEGGIKRIHKTGGYGAEAEGRWLQQNPPPYKPDDGGQNDLGYNTPRNH